MLRSPVTRWSFIFEQALEPREDVAEGALTGFEGDQPGQYRALRLTADAGDRAVVAVGDEEIVAARAHALEEHSGADPRADGSGVSVHRARADDDLRVETELFRPFGL